jgi:DNA primase
MYNLKQKPEQRHHGGGPGSGEHQMLIPEHILQQISSRINIVDLINEYVRLTKKGSRYWGLCPFHNEKTSSFCVTPEKQVFYCFGCHKGGSAYTFIMEVEKLSFAEAARLLAKKAGVSLETMIGSQEQRKQAVKRDAFIELNQRICGSFHHLLCNSGRAAHARIYLEKRGIDAALIEEFQLGYAPKSGDWLHDFLLKKNYTPGFLKESGLFSKNGNSYFHDRIMFPIYNTKSEVVGFGGRNLSEYGPKYINSPENSYFHKGDNLYGIHRALAHIKEKSCFILVEGYTDVLALFRAGIKHCVAPLGTAFTEQQARLLKRYADKGYLLFDSDEAGMKATLRTIEILENNDIQVEVLELPRGLDPADTMKEKQGNSVLQNLLESPINGFQYILKHALTLFDADTPHGKERIFNHIFPYLRRIRSQVKQYGYMEILADALRVDKDAVWADFLHGRAADTPLRSGKEQKTKEKISIELFLMCAVSIFRQYFPKVRSILSLDDIEDETARKLYIALEECFRNDEESLDALLEKIDDQGLKELLLKKISSEEYTSNEEKIIDDSIRRIKQKSLEKKRDLIERQLKAYEKNDNNMVNIRELQMEKMYLDGELQKMKVP